MDREYIGNPILGNFNCSQEIDDLENCRIEKIGDKLNLYQNGKIYFLEPVDDDAKFVVSQFDDDTGDMNATIYKAEFLNNYILITVYTYSDIQKLLGDNQKIRIHLNRVDEQDIVDEGLKCVKLDSKDEIIPFLRDEFIVNKSIFVHIDPKNTKTFEMYGTRIRAQVELERNGVYVIKKIYKSYNREYSYNLVQLFGNIDFVSFHDSLSIDSTVNLLEDNIRANTIFDAWQKYMDFIDVANKSEVKKFGIIKYSKIITRGSLIYFQLTSPVDLELCCKNEFAFLSTYNLKHGIIPQPDTFEELIKIKDLDYRTIHVNSPIKESSSENVLAFEIPSINYFSEQYLNFPGVLYLSFESFAREKERRTQILNVINTQKNPTCKFVIRLCNPKIKDSQNGYGIKNIVDEDILFKMLGDKNAHIQEHYREAMSVALNTPDIALIQGPPGTGKSTLIAGIVSKLQKTNKNYKIGISTEQHNALDVVVNKLSSNKIMPPHVISKRFRTSNEEMNEDEIHFEQRVLKFQESFLDLCDKLIKNDGDNRKEDLIMRFVVIFQDIEYNNYSIVKIANFLDEINNIVIQLGYTNELKEDLLQLELMTNKVKSNTSISPERQKIINIISAQRTDLRTYLDDDGKEQFDRLVQAIDDEVIKDFRIRPSLKRTMLSGDKYAIKEAFDGFIDAINELKDIYMPAFTYNIEKETINAKDVIQRLKSNFFRLNKRHKNTFKDIIQDLRFQLSDSDSAALLVKKYTGIVGSTCAQSEKIKMMLPEGKDQYDVVIIDEAARANPLDIFIPMQFAKRVILIGDHKQLPQYVETEYVNKLKKSQDKLWKDNEDILTKSIFEMLFDNLEKAYKDGRISYRRTIQLNEQFRMNPVIGTFISNEFYEGTITNAANTSSFVNDYGLFNGKSLAWLDIPIISTHKQDVYEVKSENSYIRPIEIDVIITKVLRPLFFKNTKREIKIGIISFYKAQVDAIRDRVNKEFSKESVNISVDTVDAFQGEEFDVLIISGVRANNEQNPSKALGFIDYSPSRINVALSRAKRLLVFVGDKRTYMRNNHFKNFIDYVEKEGYNE